MKLRILLSFGVILFLGMFASSVSAAGFKDIGDTHRAKDEIYFLSEGNIVNGSSDGSFYPDKEVTRAEAAAMIGRALQLDGTRRYTIFKDTGIGNFASGYIQEAVDRKIIAGYSDGTFKPNKPVTRGEMALFISRAFNYNATSVSSASTELMSRGISQGLGDGSFGTNYSIKRADYSVFLARAINSGLRLEGQSLLFPKTMYVVTDGLNYRTGPSTYYPSVGKYNHGKKVEVAYSVGDWVYARVDGEEGFLHSGFLHEDPNGKPTPPSDPLSDEVVVIDPGHGGSDPGASGFGINEKDVVLATALKVKSYFQKTPINVKLTRETDTFLELWERVSFAKRVNGDLFVSVHANAFNGSANGTETYYYGLASTNPYVNQSEILAAYIQERLLDAWQLSDRGVKHGNFHVIRENTMPAVLAELGFIDNKSDNDKLRSAYWQDLAAKAIFLGTLDYYYHYEKKDVLSLYSTVGASPSRKLH
jgi:N-acetylmuramoyl-L-alanine amidase